MIEPEVADLLTVAQAIAIIDAARVEPRVVEVPLAEADALVLARELRADRDYPPFDKSLMDGFAVCCGDLDRLPAELRVVGEIAAGEVAPSALRSGETMAIMTGAPLPPGADGVVPIEEIERTASRVRVRNPVTSGRFIARRGSDVRAGEVVLSRGATMGPAQLAVAAGVGAATVAVFARPRAAVIGTGDELVPLEQAPGAAQIRNSNNIMLVSLLKRWGCEVRDLGIVRDEPDAVRHALREGARYDLLLVSGGMSMGEYDYVPRTLIELGAKLRITKLRIKPGKPFVFATMPRRGEDESRDGARGDAQAGRDDAAGGSGASQECYVFGLPGNPVSAFVCTVRLASRLIGRMSGRMGAERWVDTTLGEALGANGPREFYQPVVLEGALARPLKWKGSADVFTLASANGLLVRAENEPPLPEGARVRVWEI